MNNTREDAGTELLHKQTSDRMAEMLWKQYLEQFPSRFQDVDYRYRLRMAHSLILRFYHVYFNQIHEHPTLASQEWLIRKVFNEKNNHKWPIVCNQSAYCQVTPFLGIDKG